MTKNNKGLNGCDSATPKNTDGRNHTETDPLIGWFNLSKPSHNRQKKRGRRRNERGWIDYALAGQLALLVVILALILAGVAA